ncbi:hypothetical protein Tco_0670557 [Tanacetum coccineum]
MVSIKQVPLTNKPAQDMFQLMGHATDANDGQIITETVQRRAPAPSDQPLAIQNYQHVQRRHEDAESNGVQNHQSSPMRYTLMLNQIFDNCESSVDFEMHQEEHLDSDVESDIDDNTIPDGTPLMLIRDTNGLVNDSLRLLKLARCKQEMQKISALLLLASDIVVPPSSNFLCEELRSNCDREHSKVVDTPPLPSYTPPHLPELEAEILKKQQMLNESEKRCAFIEKNHVNLQVKFQKYKETRSSKPEGSTVGSFDKQALETELTQLKDALTSVRIQIDGYKAENVNLKFDV